jgi:predicted nucleotidyltransferase
MLFFIRLFLFMQVTPQHLATIVERAERCGVRKVVLFGGALEHPHDTEDIDIAVDAPDFIAFAVDLDAHLSCSVDVVPIQRGTPFIEHILQKGRVLYAA